MRTPCERAVHYLQMCAHSTRMTRQAARLQEVLPELTLTERAKLAELGTRLDLPARMTRRALALGKQNPVGHNLIFEIADTLFGPPIISQCIGTAKGYPRLSGNAGITLHPSGALCI